jgi:PAS domain S-box-containing protein
MKIFELLNYIISSSQINLKENTCKAQTENQYQKYFDLYNNAPTMFVSVDIPSGMIIECNESLLRKTGYKREEVLSRHYSSIYHPESLKKAESYLSEFIKSGELKNIELELQTAFGSTISVLINSNAVKDKNDSILYSQSVLQDICGLKKIQDELDIAKKKAEESDLLKSAFIANMSHEIRTPLNGIIGFSHLLAEPDLTLEEKNSFVETIDNCSCQLLKLISDIFDISKIEACQDILNLVIVDLNSILDEVIGSFKSEAIKRNLNLILENNLSTKNFYIKTDPEKLRKSLINIIANALKFTDAGTIMVKVSKLANSITFSVSDTGLGIEKSNHEKIFERFWQANTSLTRNHGGTGLGLSLVKCYIEKMGGKIMVDSTPGMGSTFTIEIPLIQESENIINDSGVNVIKEYSNYYNGVTVLLAEDEANSLYYLKTILKSVGVNVFEARNGGEAVTLCRKNPEISLVLMDLQMPVMDGITATLIIKSIRTNLPVIATTAYAFNSDKEKCIAAGFDDFLSKPIKKETLIYTMSKYLNIS